jgi:hypothetical protein
VFDTLLQMLHHTWYEPSWERASLSTQCKRSASQSIDDIVNDRSDGVRDTFAQPLNSTGAILRFVNCDPATGAYSNSSANAQQSCSSAVGFAQGDNYFNNFNNLMSYVSGLGEFTEAGQARHHDSATPRPG